MKMTEMEFKVAFRQSGTHSRILKFPAHAQKSL